MIDATVAPSNDRRQRRPYSVLIDATVATPL